MFKRASIFLLAALTLALLYDSVAIAQQGPRDSDGDVPVKYVCDPHYKLPRGLGNGDPYIGRTWTQVRGDEVRIRIYINKCVLERAGAGKQDIRNVVRHERAHAKGWDHYEGTPETNPAYYPNYRITGK